jgi:hypothetical protein
VQQPAPPVYCQHCGYRFNQMGDVEETSAQLAHATGVAFECPQCFCKGVPMHVEELKRRPAQGLEPPEIPAPVRSIIESVFRVNYEEDWKHLHAQLTIGIDRTNHAVVAAHVDHVQDRANSALKLYLNLKLEYEHYKLNREIVWAAIRDEANAELQREKDAGLRNKSITDADVTAKMAELHPDEYRRVEMEKKKFELAVEQAKGFADRWADRPRDVNSLLNKMKG